MYLAYIRDEIRVPAEVIRKIANDLFVFQLKLFQKRIKTQYFDEEQERLLTMLFAKWRYLEKHDIEMSDVCLIKTAIF